MPSTKRRVARPTPRATFSDELKDAIDRDGRSPYAIARAAEVDPGILSRFLAGHRSMTTDTLDRLASAMGLHLTAATRSKGRPRRVGPIASPETGRDAPEADQGDDGEDAGVV